MSNLITQNFDCIFNATNISIKHEEDRFKC